MSADESYRSALLEAGNNAAMLFFSDEEDLDSLAVRALGCIGTVTRVDQVDVWRNHGGSEEGLLCSRVYSWNKAYTDHHFSPQDYTAVYGLHLPGWQESLASGESVDSASRPPVPAVRAYLEAQGLREVLAVPILFRASFWGFIRLGVKEGGHAWNRGEEDCLRFVGLLLAATIQRTHMQEALAESEARFRDVTMAAGEIVWELDSRGYFSYVSERVLALTGHHPDTVLGMRWEDFAVDGQTEEERGCTGRMFQASAATGFFRGFEHRVRNRDGDPIWLFSSGKLLIGPEGIAGLRGTSLDITHDKENAKHLSDTLNALEKANRELERSAESALELARKAESMSRAKSDFLANMSHEVRTPLNAIIGMAYLMQKSSLTDKQEDYIRKIHTAGISLLGVVNDILDFSKMESGKLEIEHLPFTLDSLLEHLAIAIGGNAEEKGLNTAFRTLPDVPRRLIGDSLRIGQVLSNLLGNAVKFTNEGCVDLTCSLDRMEEGRAHLRFVVRDTGIGIAEKEQAGMFQSFSQVDSSITRKYGGVGLGLVLSKNLLEISGGRLSLESAEGKGTTVTALLPLDIDASDLAEQAEADSRLADLDVILVEPCDRFREFLSGMFRDFGCKVSAFDDIGQGFAAIASQDCLVGAGGVVPRVFVLPLALAEEENASHIRHLMQDMRLANVPRLLVVAPFGHAGAGNRASALRYLCVVSRPLLSGSLRTALTETLFAWQNGSRYSSASGGADLAVPYFPDSRVLLVEDNPVNQQLATELLRDAGIHVTLAENGHEALDMLETAGPFDLVFMDLQMPEMDGFTATRRIRENPALATLPIVAMTAHATVAERRLCLEAGMSEHLVKPIDVAVLYDILRTWLKPIDASSSAVAPADESALIQGLAKLNALLLDDDAAACPLFDELEPLIRKINGDAAATAAKALAIFDFAQALSVLTPMENSLSASSHLIR